MSKRQMVILGVGAGAAILTVGVLAAGRQGGPPPPPPNQFGILVANAATGSPVAGALVNYGVVTLMTGSTGVVLFDLNGTQVLGVTASGFQPFTNMLFTPAGGQNYKVQLAPVVANVVTTRLITMADEDLHSGAQEFYEAKLEIDPGSGSQTTWYFHMALAQYPTMASINGNVLTLDNAVAAAVIDLSTGGRTVTVKDISTVPTGFRNLVQNGDVWSFAPFPAYSGRGIFPFGANSSSLYKVHGQATVTRQGGAQLTGAADWFRLSNSGPNSVGFSYATDTLESSWSIITSNFGMYFLDLVNSSGSHWQGGGVIWLDNGEADAVGFSVGAQALSVVPSSGCTSFQFSVPAARLAIAGTVNSKPWAGAGCAFQDSSLSGSLAELLVLGVNNEYSQK